MANEVEQAGELGFLLALVDPDEAARVRRRTGLRKESAATVTEPPRGPAWGLGLHHLPASVVWWMLQQDDPRVNALVYRHCDIDNRVRHDILSGVPHGPGRTRRVQVHKELARYPAPEVPRAAGPAELTSALREVGSMAQGRAAALMVGREDWAVVAEADRKQPLPGYARWALSVRPDCPPELRTQFGTHRKFTHRLEDAGIVDGPAVYATTTRPARETLSVLAMGRWAFPDRLAEAGAALEPLVRTELGGNTEAWAVLTQLLPTFTGTLPELVTTARAIAGDGDRDRDRDRDRDSEGEGEGDGAEEVDGPLSVGSGTTDPPGHQGDAEVVYGGPSWDTGQTLWDGGLPSGSTTGGRLSAGVRRIRTSWRRPGG
ncbi:hypothetical protein ACFWVC_24180 [Streptomyces sp. NPDC058691]|uniref:hypothetical protein n=1 Tax=Streptomyces sp. NPDC058691 TaxID=3346601 RepID=UPI003660D66A